ncbi:hypothetical protein SPRG_19579 [Saprolegnia parasitica CBS 223.65]|uniref:Membrane protein BRI3 n=1 Tax=Saprolegnia parasitica (strain CBS 223.65) TaxID=695850 RepID=A0A067CWX8_SAPPC|nr:hypothetical protein SPRG_19579 [Saprolegnia parasitica CBS 223.65]KDO31051.1 hypothetical protein SPRG_19579 [Saprolegnia parasitica CBS 223.65]|eukprot:XP_012198312.1 hypothetical protein SPRG_19579 [Saprolegnia parasitica CBS 223.65]
MANLNCRSQVPVRPEPAQLGLLLPLRRPHGPDPRGYQAPPPIAQAVPVQQGQYQGQPQYYAQGVPVQQPRPDYVVVQPAMVGQVVVMPGQMLTVDGYCAHAVQSNEFTLCGIVLGILFFPAGILCCLLLTERKCVHCGAVLS